ncbi:response regulator [Luteolibacter pohnpeiensis]|uniref:Response regulator n=1 Tax=Luteolibacter pohnpeiensis TaxID=454153 RepID=A0A934S4H2_9BACT|nr:response regulator [Luteolibacter pohnpeiensis]MBK1881055.1 response regulator [Luteolibacter pohnpeiensis]
MSTEIDAYDYKKYAILFVDDEATTRKYFRRLFGEKFRILEAEDGIQAMAVFRENADEIGIVVTDQRMPNETGVGFLSKIAGDYPDVIKILSTAYSDIDAAIGSVNQGGIFRYMTKPWDIPQLEVTLRRAMEFFTVKRERDALLGAKMQAMGNVLLSSRLAAFALVPVCAGIPSEGAAEAVASFVQACVAGRRTGAEGDSALRSPDWSRLHERQVALASALESELPKALATPSDIPARIQFLASALQAAGAASATFNPEESRIAATSDPMPELLDSLLGRTDDPQITKSSISVIAAYMALYDAGAIIRRVRGEGLTLSITTSPNPTKAGNPGTQTAKWLFDDDMLISAALGLL